MYYFLHSCSPVFYLSTLAFVHADVCVCTIAAIVSLIFKFRVKHNNLQYKRHYLVIGSFVIQCISLLCIGGPCNNVPYSRKSWRELYLADSLFLLFGGI